MRGLLALLATAALAATPAQIVARLNAERAANGIPAGITLNPSWTTGCKHHIAYEQLNHLNFTHVEVPGKPGFTKDGQLAGGAGDQQYGLGGWDAGDPFDRLPLHLANLMAPTLQQIGAYEADGRSCVVVALGYTRRVTANKLFIATARGRASTPASETVHNEEPASPGDAVGLPQGTTTGPTIYVLSAGPWTVDQPLQLTTATVRGPGGPVAVKLVVPAQHPKIKPYVAPGVFFVIPVKPLQAGATYRVTVTVTSAKGTTLTATSQFRTTA
jgi:hypothetical protein